MGGTLLTPRCGRAGECQTLIQCADVVSDAILTQRLGRTGKRLAQVGRLIQKQAAQPAQVVQQAATIRWPVQLVFHQPGILHAIEQSLHHVG